MQWPVIYERKIRYSDTDSQQIVFNGNYLTYLDDALTDYLDALGGTWEAMHAQGFDIVLAHIDLAFRSPARLRETVAVHMEAVEVGNSSVRFAFEIRERDSGRVIVKGTAVHVIVDATTLEKRPVPTVLIEGIERLQGAPLPRRS